MPDTELTVHLTPRAKRNAIVEERDGVLRVSVAAAPVDGQANAALCKLIAKRAGIARGRVSVTRGARTREKLVRVEDIALAELRLALGLHAPATSVPEPLLRELTRADWPRLLELNLASERELSALDEQRLEWILSLAQRAIGVERDGEVVGFALALAPGSSYDSENYRWFASRFERFLYLDRIAVAESQRRQGLGMRLYDAMETAARPFARMVCEVNVLPANPASLAFHAARGYTELARLEHTPEKVVALLSKELPGAARQGERRELGGASHRDGGKRRRTG
jgi:predicted GNAT superfamily acetyltransferase/uncharacterized protein YggU (UPF0235/DUF167 family)